MQNYKDLKVWEKGHYFTLKGYEITKNFPREELYSLTNQIRRTSSYIPANIAEGCGKSSHNDFAHYLNMALGSSNEAESFLILCKDLGYLTEGKFNKLFSNNYSDKRYAYIINRKSRRKKTYNVKLITNETI